MRQEKMTQDSNLPIADKKKPENGTFTQIPNVFFDTCDLPESAQILYLRLYRHIAYKDDHKFTGSLRKLGTLVRQSKSTVERMVKKLEESRLISIGSEPSLEHDRDVMTITLNPKELWLLNKQHYENNDVPIWDKDMPIVKVLSQIGTLCPDMGQHDVNLGQTVPDVSSKSAQERISTNNKDKEGGMKERQPSQELSTSSQPNDFSFSLSLPQNKSSSLSSPETKVSLEKQETKAGVVFSAEEEVVYTLAEQLDLVYLKRDVNHKESCAKLVAKGVTTQEKMESLIVHCKQVPFLAGKTLNLKNLANEVSGWAQLHRPLPEKVYKVGELHLRPFRDAAAESLAKQEEVKKRIQEQEKAQGRPQLTLKERMAAFNAKQKVEAQQNSAI